MPTGVKFREKLDKMCIFFHLTSVNVIYITNLFCTPSFCSVSLSSTLLLYILLAYIFVTGGTSMVHPSIGIACHVEDRYRMKI